MDGKQFYANQRSNSVLRGELVQLAWPEVNPDSSLAALASRGGASRGSDEPTSRVGIHIMQYGQRDSSAPAVLLMGGLGMTWHDWQDVVLLLESDHRVIVYDRAGAGLSEAVESSAPSSLFQEIEIVREVLDYCKVERAILVGHSMAGFIAEGFARIYLQRCAHLILLDASYEEKVAGTKENITRLLKQTERPARMERFAQRLCEIWCARKMIAFGMYLSRPRPMRTISSAADKKICAKVYQQKNKLCSVMRELRGYELWAAQCNYLGASETETAGKYRLQVPTTVVACQVFGRVYWGSWVRYVHGRALRLKQENPILPVRFCFMRGRHVAMRANPKAVVRVIRKSMHYL